MILTDGGACRFPNLFLRFEVRRARLPASRQASFDLFSPASESRGVKSPAKPQEQGGKENQQESVEMEKLVVHRLCEYTVSDFSD